MDRGVPTLVETFMSQRAIDPEKLRATIGLLSSGQLVALLADALDQLPASRLTTVVGRHIDIATLAPDSVARKASPARAIADFVARARAGRYYEGFKVNSKNYRELSNGTRVFFVECRRCFEDAVALAKKGDPVEARRALTSLLELMRQLDLGDDDIVFFADEGGSWQIGIDWDKVLPAWFKCLAKTAKPAEFAKLTVAAIDDFDTFDREQHLAKARRVATPEQRLALDAIGPSRATAAANAYSADRGATGSRPSSGGRSR